MCIIIYIYLYIYIIYDSQRRIEREREKERERERDFVMVTEFFWHRNTFLIPDLYNVKKDALAIL